MRMEVDAGSAAVLLRALPLVVAGRNVSTAILIRDVTEVKRRDRSPDPRTPRSGKSIIGLRTTCRRWPRCCCGCRLAGRQRRGRKR